MKLIMRHLLLFFLLSILGSSSFAATSYTKEASYCPVTMHYDSLGDLINGIRTIAKSANTEAEKFSIEKLSIESSSIKIDLAKNFTKQELLNGPSNATSIRYWLSGSEDIAVSEVRLYFTDHTRSVKVSGTSKEHVNTVVLLVSNHMNETGCSVGGNRQRMFGGLAIFASAVILGLLPSMGVKLSNPASSVNFIAIFLLYILIFVPNWESIFPGTLITISDEGFYERHSGLISVLGLAAGILSIFLNIYYGSSSGSIEAKVKSEEVDSTTSK